MLVQTYFPQKLSASRYDTFLASGWFRGSVMLYKMDLLCLEGDVRSVVNIRLDLNKHDYSKSHRKIIKRVEERFTFTYGEAFASPEKEVLYARHKNRFKGFIHPTLTDYLNSGFYQNVFDTQEICVYDGDKLIAVSFFDRGERSMASLLGLYDENYHKFSLGLYTMLKEISLGKSWNYRWYYPGYVLDQSSQFDYKLRLGEFEYYNQRQRWAKFTNFSASETKTFEIKAAIAELEEKLVAAKIPFAKTLYPLFSLGYVGYWNAEFVKYPIFLSVQLPGDQELLMTYDIDLRAFVVNKIVEAPEYDHLINMEASSDFGKGDDYLMKLMMVSEHLLIVPAHETRMLDAFIEQSAATWFN